MSYWNRRYRRGGHSGKGSRGTEAEEKARLVSQMVAKHEIGSLLDIGCGDGYVAALLDLGACGYLGVDPAPHAIKLARKRAPGLSFEVLKSQRPREAHLSMDVIFHLVEEKSYRDHMKLLFSAHRVVMVYASDYEEAGAAHVLHRHWTSDVPEEWWQTDMVPVTDRFSFYVYVRS